MNDSTSEQKVGVAVNTDSRRERAQSHANPLHENGFSLALKEYFDFLRKEETPPGNQAV